MGGEGFWSQRSGPSAGTHLAYGLHFGMRPRRGVNWFPPFPLRMTDLSVVRSFVGGKGAGLGALAGLLQFSRTVWTLLSGFEAFITCFFSQFSSCVSE